MLRSDSNRDTNLNPSHDRRHNRNPTATPPSISMQLKSLSQDGDLLVLDPGLKEEAARGGALTVVANAHKELCAVHKTDGIGLSLAQARRALCLGFSSRMSLPGRPASTTLSGDSGTSFWARSCNSHCL